MDTNHELEDNKTTGKVRKTRHWWQKEELTFTPPVTHDPKTQTQVARRQGLKLKRKMETTEHVVIGDQTVPVDQRYLDFNQEQ